MCGKKNNGTFSAQTNTLRQEFQCVSSQLNPFLQHPRHGVVARVELQRQRPQQNQIDIRKVLDSSGYTIFLKDSAYPSPFLSLMYTSIINVPSFPFRKFYLNNVSWAPPLLDALYPITVENDPIWDTREEEASAKILREPGLTPTCHIQVGVGRSA